MNGQVELDEYLQVRTFQCCQLTHPNVFIFVVSFLVAWILLALACLNQNYSVFFLLIISQIH